MNNSDVVIRVESLGKKYSLHHEQPERYRALRDSLARKVMAAGQLLNPFTLVGQLSRSQRQSHLGNEAQAPEEEFWALQDVSFEIHRGDRVGIIGRNGAGKSTLLKILSRITEPTTGRVEILGRVASLLEVGTGFHPELSGRENIYLNGAILGMTRGEIRAKFDEIVEFAEVEKFLDTPVKRYSSGMYVRLAFAVAAHLEPEILVVDEVLAVGDISFQKKCLGKMEDVAEQEGRTILFVSHNTGALKSICNTGILIESGKLKVFNEILEAIRHYETSSAISSIAYEKSWHDISSPPGDSHMRLTLVRIEQNGCLGPFHDDKPITIHIDVTCFERAQAKSLGLIVTERSGDVAIHTLSTAARGTKKYFRKGKNSIIFTFPAGIFKAGIYKVDVCGVESMICIHFNVKDVLCFEVISINPEFNRHGGNAWLATSGPSICEVDVHTV